MQPHLILLSTAGGNPWHDPIRPMSRLRLRRVREATGHPARKNRQRVGPRSNCSVCGLHRSVMLQPVSLEKEVQAEEKSPRAHFSPLSQRERVKIIIVTKTEPRLWGKTLTRVKWPGDSEEHRSRIQLSLQKTAPARQRNWPGQPPPTYCTGELPGAFLEQAHDLGLLGGGAAAADHRRALAGQLHELVLVVLEANLWREEGGWVSQGHFPQGSRKEPVLLGGPAWRSPCAHLQRVSRDDQGAVVLPAEGVQLKVGLATVGHLGRKRGVRRLCSPEMAEQRTVASWYRREDNGHPSQGPLRLPCHQTDSQIKSCLL